MKFCDLKEIKGISPLSDGGNPFRAWKRVYCCDLLSHALAHAPAGCAFITVIANENTLAVALRREVSCVVFAEGVVVPETLLSCAKQHGIALAASTLPAFEAGLLLQEN